MGLFKKKNKEEELSFEFDEDVLKQEESVKKEDPEPKQKEKTKVVKDKKVKNESTPIETIKEEDFSFDNNVEDKVEESNEPAQEVAKPRIGNKPAPAQKRARVITATISVLAGIGFLFVPFINSLKPIDFFKQDFSSLAKESYIVIASFVLLMLTALINLYLYFDAIAHYKYDTFSEKINRVLKFNFFIGIVYGIAGLALLFIDLFSSKTGLTCYSYFLTIVQILLLIVNSVVESFFTPDYIIMEKYQNEETLTPYQRIKAVQRPFPSFELFFYTLIFSVLPIGVLFLDLFTVCVNGQTVQGPIKGIDFLTKMGTFTNTGYKIISFLFFLFIVVDGVLLIMSLVTYLTKRKMFYKISISAIVINFCFICFVSLYGLYYKIVQASTVENIQTLLEQFFPGSEPVIEVLKGASIKTQSYFVAIGATLLLIFILARNPSRYALLYEQLDQQAISEEDLNASIISDEPLPVESTGENNNAPTEEAGNAGATGASASASSGSSSTNGKENGSSSTSSGKGPLDVNVLKRDAKETELDTFDACPAFTELDSKLPEYEEALAKREAAPFKGKTLPSLVTFIVDYAKNSRLHLSYCKEDIAAFIAGLGCTRLTILQGMSGTGKTSLPKIFMEALYGNCELIEIESSWREKNELLGFYNEFSKMYTPKKFTQCLYKAALNPDVITMIVLDEMNLSRIEYYFSDFLSLMENEEDQRQIKLSNIKLFNIYDHEKHSYLKLSEDHTLKIPTNVWFIGTANRDESTFEISDKVYDRAHTMNFNKRAPAIKDFGAVMKPEFLKYDIFAKMLNDAEKKYEFDIEKNKTIMEVEKLMVPFNISFGNRIYRQIENFVKVYCSCFSNPKEREFEAVETILLTKVVMKLENKNIDNRDALISEFRKLKLMRCVDFISKLSEDF